MLGCATVFGLLLGGICGCGLVLGLLLAAVQSFHFAFQRCREQFDDEVHKFADTDVLQNASRQDWDDFIRLDALMKPLGELLASKFPLFKIVFKILFRLKKQFLSVD